MQIADQHSTRTTKPEDPKPRKGFPLVYTLLVLSFCTLVGSVWFSSYAKKVALQRQPVYERQKHRIQDEIYQLELEQSTLTSIQRIRKIATELGMVEPTETSQIVWDR